MVRMSKFKSNARETWCVILVSESWHILLRITALYTSFRSAQNHCLPDNVRPRGAFISVGDCTPTEKDLLLLTTCRSGSLLDWDKKYCYPSQQKSFFHLIYIRQLKHANGFLKFISSRICMFFDSFYTQKQRANALCNHTLTINSSI